tara:strand:- start:1191 stop:1499 length:309 start_codon:yes stop_codon:yes gene_type:complete
MLKIYYTAITVATMVEIQCPNCEEDIELEDGVFGLFDCPNCDEEFIWKDNDNRDDFSNEQIDHFPPMPLGFKIIFSIPLILLLLLLIAVLFLAIAFSGMSGP